MSLKFKQLGKTKESMVLKGKNLFNKRKNVLEKYDVLVKA
jgi:hypothetical protein